MALDETVKEKVLNSVIQKLSESSFSGEFFEDVLERLDSLGYVIKGTDDWMISFSIQKIENTIKNECNVTSVPDGLNNVAIDMICGDLLLNKKQSGQLEDFDLDQAMTTVTAGDTSVTFDTKNTSEGRLNNLISYLISNGRGEFISYRQIKW